MSFLPTDQAGGSAAGVPPPVGAAWDVDMERSGSGGGGGANDNWDTGCDIVWVQLQFDIFD